MAKKKDDFIDFEDNVKIDKTTGTMIALGGLAILGGIVSMTSIYHKANSIPEVRKKELLSQYDNLSHKVQKEKLISSLTNDYVERFYLDEYATTKGKSKGQACTWLTFPEHTLVAETNKSQTAPQTVQSGHLPAQKHIQFKERTKG